MLSFFTNNLLWTQGLTICVFIIICFIVGWWLIRPVLYFSILLFLFSLFFFRNPDRRCLEAEKDLSLLVCPADGKVVSIEKLSQSDDFESKVSIFLSPLDVHVTRSPLSAVVEQIQYRKGEFKMAFLPKSSELNEANDILLRTGSGKLLKVRQIAGTIARVIVCWVKQEERLKAGQSFGMIKFGSRVELFLPKTTTLFIKEGQKVVGGQTVIGRLQ